MSARFRVTDERGWSFEFSANSGETLRAGIRGGWDSWIAGLSSSRDTTHPAFAFVARLAEIRRWRDQRAARPNATDEQRASWDAQVAHWTYEATRDLGGATHLSPLRLHVLTDENQWCTIMRRSSPASVEWKCDPIPPQVAHVEPVERCDELFAGGIRMVEWSRELAGLAGQVGEAVREAQFPAPTLVRE